MLNNLSTEKEPLISIIVLTYNRKTLLKKCLDSIINQTYENIEILIADNHSEDGTEELCLQYAKQDSRIKYFRHEKNIGPINNAEFIYTKITGDYFIPVCDDDWLDVNFTEECIKTAFKNPKYVMIAPVVKVYKNNYSLNSDRKNKVRKLSQNDLSKRLYEFLKYNPYDFIAQGLFQTKIISEIRKYQDCIFYNRLAEDSVFMLKVLCIGNIKMIDSTSYNKFTPQDSTKHFNEYWGLAEIDENFIWNKSGDAIKQALLNDNIFKSYLSSKNINFLVAIVNNYHAIIEKEGIKRQITLMTSLKQLFNYTSKRPFFFLRKKFYKDAIKLIKIYRN